MRFSRNILSNAQEPVVRQNNGSKCEQKDQRRREGNESKKRAGLVIWLQSRVSPFLSQALFVVNTLSPHYHAMDRRYISLSPGVESHTRMRGSGPTCHRVLHMRPTVKQTASECQDGQRCFTSWMLYLFLISWLRKSNKYMNITYLETSINRN